jgi:hypothetical protein
MNQKRNRMGSIKIFSIKFFFRSSFFRSSDPSPSFFRRRRVKKRLVSWTLRKWAAKNHVFCGKLFLFFGKKMISKKVSVIGSLIQRINLGWLVSLFLVPVLRTVREKTLFVRNYENTSFCKLSFMYDFKKKV